MSNKEYMKMYMKRRREASPYIVYHIPSDNYYGHTKNVKSRMLIHQAAGRNTEGYEIVYTSEDKKQALFKEQQLQGKTRVCSECSQEKIAGDFWKGYKNKKGIYNEYSSTCKQCIQTRKRK
jgi:predicted GIY-YIG superfamily endonuclease